MTPSAQETLVSLLSDVLPTLPLMVLAVIEDTLRVRESFLGEIVCNRYLFSFFL